MKRNGNGKQAETETETDFYSFTEKGKSMENETYETESGKLKLKDSASKILLAVSFRCQLQGNFEKADFIQKEVAENCSENFIDNMEKEIFFAKSKAVSSLHAEGK